MIYYILLLIFMAAIVLNGYYIFFLYKNDGGSSLYQRIAVLGIFGFSITFINILSLTNYMFNFVNIKSDLNFFSFVIQVLFTYNLFKVWEIRHNQFGKHHYRLPIILLTLLSGGLLFINKFQFFIMFNSIISNLLPILLNTFILIVINLLFLRFNKLSGGSDFRIFPLIISILILVNVGFIFLSLNKLTNLAYFLTLLLQSLAYLLIMKVSHDDFKKSFYY